MEAGADDQALSLSGCPVTEVDFEEMCREGEDEGKGEDERKRIRKKSGGE